MKIIKEISKVEAKKLADKGLKYHKDILTGKWKRRRYYLCDDMRGKNIALLNVLRK